MDIPELPRVTTGVRGLDPLLEGGLLAGGVYLVEGSPGTGKTILGNQICFHHASEGGRVFYCTLLAESHARMLAHLRRLSFYKRELVGDSVYYVSAFKDLEEDGLTGLVKLMRRMVAERDASLIVVDGLVTAVEAAGTRASFKQFVHEVQTFSSHLGCTTLLLSSSDPSAGVQPEHTIVDGIIELSDDLLGLRSLRHIQIRKLRGARQVRGQHSVVISDDGIVVHPRFEAAIGRQRSNKIPGPPRRAFGVEQLDKMLMGGVPSGSISMLLGASGCGKTILALQFLAAGAAAGERGLYFGFYERPPALLAKCKRIQIGLQDGVDANMIELMWERPIEGVLDVLAERMLSRVRETGVTRLVIDGLQTLRRTVDFPERTRAVSAALSEELEGLGVTTVYTLETQDLVGSEIKVPIDDLSAMSHNIIAIRYAERRARYDRLISIMKVRDSDFDRSIRELDITERGVEVSSSLLAPTQGLSSNGRAAHPGTSSSEATSRKQVRGRQR